MPHVSELDWSAHTHTHIGLDLDETLATTMGGMLECAHQSGKLLAYQNIEDISSYHIPALDPNLSMEDGYAIGEDYGKSTLHPESIPLIDHAKSGVDTLLKYDKKLTIITARSDNKAWHKPRTLNWIHHHFPMIKDIHFTNHFTTNAQPKSHICKTWKISLVIDDSIENAEDLCHAGISMILLTKPWNSTHSFDHPLLYRAKD